MKGIKCDYYDLAKIWTLRWEAADNDFTNLPCKTNHVSSLIMTRVILQPTLRRAIKEIFVVWSPYSLRVRDY